MTRQDKMLFDLLKTILWLFLIAYVATIWIINETEPAIVYIVVPQLKIEDIQSNQPDVSPPISSIEPQYGFTEDEIYLMTALLSGSKYIDGDGEYDIDFDEECDQEQINLVLSVVMNRVESDQFPNTVSEIIWSPGQFAPMIRWVTDLPEVSDISLQKVREWCKAYDAYNPNCKTIPDNHLYFYGNGIVNKSRERWYN